MPEPSITPPDRAAPAFLFDVFGVLIRTQGRAHLERIDRELGEPGRSQRLMEVYAELRPALDAGRVSETNYWNQIRLRAGLEFLDPAEAIEVDYRGVVEEENRDVVDLVLDLRARGYRVGILSNIPEGLARDLRNAHSTWLDKVDSVTFSYEIGAAKPEPEAFHAALESLGVPAERVIFIDDTERNVAAAREEGLQAIHFRGIDSLLADPLMEGLL
ncbi:HAD family hydrolase [Corynebacterium pacaense]|uniref:HAD family hydrolase n=1 Tax=Corynebacterium pacaense TaxID=1816684 RepID=UPI0009BA1C36|nr:HAD family phosphatase [Corynebacterium pacaense]